MKVQLKVLSGSHAGKCVPIARSQFVIGRGEGCHVRSNSDAVSRRHCVITQKGPEVTVRDLGSRNGTFVNGVRVEGDHALASGDQLIIGPLQFEVLIGESAGGTPATAPAAAPHARPGGGTWDDATVGQWLDEADAAERARRMDDPDTRIFKFDETIAANQASQKDTKAKKGAEPKKPAKKLPPKKDLSKDSQEAAAQMLRRLFNRG